MATKAIEPVSTGIKAGGKSYFLLGRASPPISSMMSTESGNGTNDEFCTTLSIVNEFPKANIFCSALKQVVTNDHPFPTFNAEISGDLVSDKHLQRLNIANQKLQSANILHLSVFQSLNYLNLSFNRLVDIKSLTQLTNLVFLDISHNKIASIEPIRGMEKLETLRCSNNVIESLEPLSRLCNIASLWISDNNIQWGDLIYLSVTTKLSILIKSDNPCNDKPKIDEFVVALLPQLTSLDGIALMKGATPSSDFFRTTDGRVMLTQAKAQMPSALRTIVNGAGFSGTTTTSGAALNTTRSTTSTTTSPLKRMTMNDTPLSRKVLSQQINSSTNDFDSTTDSIKSMGMGADGPFKVQKFKIQQRNRTGAQPVGTGKKFAGTADANQGDWIDESKVELGDIAEDTFVGDEASITNNYNNNNNNTSTSNNISSINSSSPTTLLKFGHTMDSPIALCLYPGGDGYIRWSKGSTIACSLEKRRMFASHRGGSMAVVYDANGNGSVMDSKGRNVFVISESGTAKVLDTQGLILNTYNRGQTANSNNSSEVESSPSGGGGGQIQQWTFDGLHIEFHPVRWELLVKVQNDRAVCSFSSIDGGKLIKDRSSNDTKSAPGSGGSGVSTSTRLPHASRQPSSSSSLSSSAQSATSGGDGVTGMTSEKHNSIRTGLQSIVMDLDNVMNSIRNR